MARPFSSMNFFRPSSSSSLKPSSVATAVGTGYSIFKVALVSSEASRASTGLMTYFLISATCSSVREPSSR